MTNSIPANIKYGTVTGRFLLTYTDGDDYNTELDWTPAKGSVLFTPSAPYLMDLDENITFIPSIVEGVLDSEGYIISPDGLPGIKLLATDNEDVTPQEWTWRADFRLTDQLGNPTRGITAFSFAVPKESTQDLSVLSPVPDSNGVFYIVGPKGEAGPQGEPGEQGPRGLGAGDSAYEVAVRNGFVGTEEEWLDSLQGADGEPGPPGPQGPQGIQGETSYGGPEGPAGPPGPAGADGAEGPAGPQGPAGADGIDGTEGPQGERGPGIDRVEAYSIEYYQPAFGSTYIDDDGQQVLILSIPRGVNGTNGQDGEPGPQGLKGANGTNGVDGKSAYQIALESGRVDYITTPEGSRLMTASEWAESLNGSPGARGVDGVTDEVQNVLLNGSLNVWQRGKSFTLKSNARSFAADMWQCKISDDVIQNTTTTVGSASYKKITPTATLEPWDLEQIGSLGSLEIKRDARASTRDLKMAFSTRISSEACSDMFTAGVYTPWVLSFWVKSDYKSNVTSYLGAPVYNNRLGVKVVPASTPNYWGGSNVVANGGSTYDGAVESSSQFIHCKPFNTSSDDTDISDNFTGQYGNDLAYYGGIEADGTWQRVEYLIDNSVNTPDIEVMFMNGIEIIIERRIRGDATRLATSSVNLQIASIQLERVPGDNSPERYAGPFKSSGANYDLELIACQRYYHRADGSQTGVALAQGFQKTTTTATCVYQLPISMQKLPEVSYGSLQWSDMVAVATNITSLAIKAGSDSKNLHLDLGFATSGAAFRPGVLRTSAANGFIEFKSDL